MNRKIIFATFLSFGLFQFASAQSFEKKPLFTHADTLRGSLNPNRTWWDVLRYDLTVKPDFNSKTIEGRTVIEFKTVYNVV